MTSRASYIKSSQQKPGFWEGMEKIELCVRHCAGPLSGRVDGGFQLCDLKNPTFLLVKKQSEIMHILFCSNYILLVSFLCAKCGLYSSL